MVMFFAQGGFEREQETEEKNFVVCMMMGFELSWKPLECTETVITVLKHRASFAAVPWKVLLFNSVYHV